MYKDLIKSNAKLNFGLNILNKRDDNYHNIDSIFVPIDLYDDLEINYTGKNGKIIIHTYSINKISTEENIIYKVYNEFYKNLKLKKNNTEKKEVIVKLKKNIPIFSGLGGGSSNGAFFLKSLNKYYGNIFSIEEMINFSKNISADIPFFLYNTPSRIKGIGEIIEEIKINFKVNIILIKPNFGISTKLAYENIKKIDNVKYSNIEKVVEGLKKNDVKLVESNIENVLDQGLFTNNDIIEFKKKFTLLFENIKLNMSGSGSCFYIFDYYNSNLIEKLKFSFPEFLIIKCKLV